MSIRYHYTTEKARQYLGSGSIAIACHNMGFDLDAYELDVDYYEAAVKRLNDHKAQGTLFTPKQVYG